MEIRFNRERDSGLAHCFAEHGVSEREAIEILRRPMRRFRRNADGTLVAEGQTNAGRYLRVIYRDYSLLDYLFVITAYDLPPVAKRAFRRWRRRK